VTKANSRDGTGSLPRPPDMIEMLVAKAAGDTIDGAARQARLPDAVKQIVQKQIELGIDIIDDGEYSKPSFVIYATERGDR
jgi:5-methyltetrahydropteroyltriglutamate--homocysteine methyltransferase